MPVHKGGCSATATQCSGTESMGGRVESCLCPLQGGSFLGGGGDGRRIGVLSLQVPQAASPKAPRPPSVAPRKYISLYCPKTNKCSASSATSHWGQVCYMMFGEGERRVVEGMIRESGY